MSSGGRVGAGNDGTAVYVPPVAFDQVSYTSTLNRDTRRATSHKQSNRVFAIPVLDVETLADQRVKVGA